MSLTNKIAELKAFETAYAEKRNEILSSIEGIVRSVGQNPALTPIGDGKIRMFTVSASELMGGSWSLEQLDWEKQATMLLDFLSKRPIEIWDKFIKALLGKKKAGSDILPANVRFTIMGETIVLERQFSYKFLKAVSDKL